MNNKIWRVVGLILTGVAIGLLIMAFFGGGSKQPPVRKQPQISSITYSQFFEEEKNGELRQVKFLSDIIQIKTKGDHLQETPRSFIGESELLNDLQKKGVQIIFVQPEETGVIENIFSKYGSTILFLIVFIGFMIYFMKRMPGGGSGQQNQTKSKARMAEPDKNKVTFADVAGCDEAKEEVSEMVDFLKDPAKYQKLGGKVPCGALMVGPPGTGKTLLARAIAGEAKVPFFTVSGSDFVEMFVGVGASRVRDLFAEARKHAPCIIFIDEIDAVGRKRGSNAHGGSDEREQTLNQLLIEMDGFEGKEGIIIIAATNRADVLDTALLRPGRFDRQVNVELPDIRGREQILAVHIKKVPVADDVMLKYIAQGTPGFSGADLANLINEAALFAARGNKQNVSMADLEKAKDKILMGVERHTMVMSEEEKKNTAYHEAGHAIVGRIVPDHDPVYKVSIMPRGRALGVTMFLPEKDEHSITKLKLLGMISALYGGRIAERIIFGKDRVTTGASNDIERATELARKMVTEWGLSRLGPICFVKKEGMFPQETPAFVEKEMRLILSVCYREAYFALKKNQDILHAMANALILYETIDKNQIDDLMNKKPVRKPEGWIE